MQVALEVALGGASLTIGSFQPAFDPGHPVLAAASMLFQILEQHPKA